MKIKKRVQIRLDINGDHPLASAVARSIRRIRQGEWKYFEDLHQELYGIVKLLGEE